MYRVYHTASENDTLTESDLVENVRKLVTIINTVEVALASTYPQLCQSFTILGATPPSLATYEERRKALIDCLPKWHAIAVQLCNNYETLSHGWLLVEPPMYERKHHA